MSRLRSWAGHAWLALPIRLYLAWVFLYACYHKIADPLAFATDVATYQLLPLWAINVQAIVLPWTELLVGLLLVLGLRVRPAALLVVGMMVMFLVALAWALAHDLHLACGCFVSTALEQDPISWRTIVRDLAWLAMGVYVLVFDARPLGLERLRFPRAK